MRVLVQKSLKKSKKTEENEGLSPLTIELLSVVRKSILEENETTEVPPKLDLYSVASALREKEQQIQKLQRIIKTLESNVDCNKPLDLSRLLNLVNKVVTATKGNLNKKK